MKAAKSNQLQRIRALENEIILLRGKLGISPRGETIFYAQRNMWSATDVVVEADGMGGAILSIVEGNYPADYLTHKEQRFCTEDEAYEEAERLIAPAKTMGYRTVPE